MQVIAISAKEEIDKAVQQVTTLLRINHLVGRLPGQLSRGEQQRVALGPG